MVIELAKYGRGARDMQAVVNFFSKVSVDEEGVMHYEPVHSPAGGYVELRAEMDTLVVLNTSSTRLTRRLCTGQACGVGDQPCG